MWHIDFYTFVPDVLTLLAASIPSDLFRNFVLVVAVKLKGHSVPNQEERSIFMFRVSHPRLYFRTSME